jgi:transcriptional regulator with XRE-family HTH domain
MGTCRIAHSLSAELTVSQDASRRELARFLRTRRERITPGQVGLPAGPRRRSPGLRREEVAVLAGLSPTWYIYLEQGRDIHPSAEVLDSLARVLVLTEDERRYMHILAHGNVRKPRPLDNEVSPAGIVTQLVETTLYSPYPVYGVDLYCDLIAWNPAVATYYADFSAMPADQRNMMHWLITNPMAQDRLPDWHTDIPDVVARWRGMVAAVPDPDQRLSGLVAEFKRLSTDFERWWETHDVREHRTRLRRFNHPDHGERTLRLIVVQASDFSPNLVVFHTPVDSTDSTVPIVE